VVAMMIIVIASVIGYPITFPQNALVIDFIVEDGG
jgi:hypothetical protein